jgi:hypothetical protein
MLNWKKIPTVTHQRSVVIYPYRTLSASMVLYPPKKRACKWVSRRKQLVRDLLRVKGVSQFEERTVARPMKNCNVEKGELGRKKRRLRKS